MTSFIKKKLTQLKSELALFSKEQRAFIFFAMLCGFFICCGYSIIRPVSNSIFLEKYSAASLPYVWLAILPFNFAMVSLYNKLIPKWGSKRLFLGLTSLIIVINLFAPFLSKTSTSFPFFFYMWKDVYVMLLFQLLWSVIHSNIKLKTAKFLYGIFFGIGGMGSMLGSALPGFFAVTYGSENLIFLSIPVYLLLTLTYVKMIGFNRGEVPKEEKGEEGGLFHGIKLITRSRFLMFILLIVIFMQMSLSIVDFQFHDFLGKAFPDKDLRTQYSGQIYGMMHTLTVGLQLVGTYLLLHWAGLKKSHFFVPSLLGLSSLLFIAAPVFPIAALLFIGLKACDHSIFTISKEMLYIPLKPEEKFQAKAVIDVFAYRSAKAVGSIIILCFQTLFIRVGETLTIANMGIALAWMICVYFGFREYDKLSARQEA